ncbi:MAG TPA: hypothetical protein VGC41_08745 [Kofleriaceae bacterium]
MLARSLLVVTLVGCHASSANAIDANGDGAPSIDGDPDPGIGCADGAREGFTDMAMYPAIAACSGAWIIPGIDADRSDDPGCKTSGNDSPTSAVACSAANLCAPAWHVCAGATEVAAHLPSGQTCTSALTAAGFFATNQGSVGSGLCGATGANDLFGCGGLGNAASTSCAPLDRSSGNNCAAITSEGWSCGSAASEERTHVIKPRVPGGVLCCK